MGRPVTLPGRASPIEAPIEDAGRRGAGPARRRVRMAGAPRTA